MGTLSLSGYEASAVTVAWTSGQSLDSLTDDETTDLSDAFDNSSSNYALADVEINLASAAFTGDDCAIELYLVPSVDGTNYSTWMGNTTSPGNANSNYQVGSVTISAGTAAARLSFRDVPLYNGLQKFALRSRANVSLAATGNTLKYRPHQIMYTA